MLSLVESLTTAARPIPLGTLKLKGYCQLISKYSLQNPVHSRNDNTRLVENDLFINLQNKPVSGQPVGIYLRKVNNKNTRTRCEICSKLTIKTPALKIYYTLF